MIKIPTLPFATTIVSGIQQDGLKTENDKVFNLDFLMEQHIALENVIPQVLTEKFTKELSHYVNGAHKDLATIIFEQMHSQMLHGVICIPQTSKFGRIKGYMTLAYSFVEDGDVMTVVGSVADTCSNVSTDTLFFTFSVEKMPDRFDLGINTPNDIKIPIMFKHGKSSYQTDAIAWHWTKFICAYEAVLHYKCLKVKTFIYDAMLEKKSTLVNPNDVKIELVALDHEEKDIL